MNEPTDANAIFAPIWRRKWLILAVGIIVAAASYLYYKRQTPVFQASTQVFLGAGAEEQAAGERGAAKAGRATALTDQASVINTIVVEQVRRRLRAKHKDALARATAKVKAKSIEKSEFITISSEASSARTAALLVNLTAEAYIRRQSGQRQRGIENAIAIDRRQLRRIEAATVAQAKKPVKATSGKAGSSTAASAGSPSAASVIQEATLSSKINQLESSFGSSTAQQVRPATVLTTQMISPKPRRDAEFGFVIGLVLAAIAAYAFSRFDRRLRSIAGIEAVTRLPLLSAMPKVRQPVVLAPTPRPSVRLLEPLRRLQTALPPSEPAAATRYGPARVILFVSPDPGDGKSTIVADLALVQRDSGERVIVVEANFRRPVLAKRLGLEGDGRLAAVLAGRLDVEEATQRVMPTVHPGPSYDEDGAGGVGVATATQAEVGSLFVLAGDRSVPNPPALLRPEAVADLFRSLAERFDYVLVDAPSPLEVSDIIPVLGLVDQIVVVARAGHSREASALRLRQLLDRPSCAPVAGVVANFVAPADLKRYGFSVAGRAWQGSRLTRR